MSCDSPQTIALSNDNDVISLVAGGRTGGADFGWAQQWRAGAVRGESPPEVFSVRAEIIDPVDPVAQDADDEDDSDEDDNDETPRGLVREAEKSALAAARAAGEGGEQNHHRECKPLSWEASYATTAAGKMRGSEESKKGIKKFLKDYMKKMGETCHQCRAHGGTQREVSRSSLGRSACVAGAR